MTAKTLESLDWLIWSADVQDRKTLFVNLATVPRLKIVKIDRLGQKIMGDTVIDELVERGYLVFDDAKLIEIPSKLEGLAREHVSHKPWMLNCMAGAVSNGELSGDELDGLKRFADVCNNAGVRSCAVTVLTTKKPEIVDTEFNGRTSIEQVLYYVELLVKFGFTDVVCSPVEAEAIRAIADFDALDINCPGIRMPDAPPDDQARTMTPHEARMANVTRQVVGRPLTKGDVAHNLALLEANYLGTAA